MVAQLLSELEWTIKTAVEQVRLAQHAGVLTTNPTLEAGDGRRSSLRESMREVAPTSDVARPSTRVAADAEQRIANIAALASF